MSAAEPAPFPWRAAMAFGLGVLRLAPDAFWRMTPRELAAAADGARGPGATPFRAATARRSLEALMRAFPDERTDPR